VGFAQAQSITPVTPTRTDAQHTAASVDDMPTHELAGKVGLVRGVVKKTDPIFDQLIVHAFGGGDVRIGFDGRTQLLADNAHTRFTTLPAGTIVSVDTVIDNGKLFARSVRTGKSNAVELSGQIISYDSLKSQLTLRDPMSPENITMHLMPTTTVVNRGQT